MITVSYEVICGIVPNLVKIMHAHTIIVCACIIFTKLGSLTEVSLACNWTQDDGLADVCDV